jgi:hypothetical protein
MIILYVWEDDLPEEIMERLAGKLCELGVLIKKLEVSKDDDEFVVTKYQFLLAEILPENPSE